MKYISTRGKAPQLGFADVTLTGLATDGGLYLPESWPQVSAEQIRAMQGMDYPTLAQTVLTYFCSEDLSQDELAKITQKAYQNFDHTAIAPLKQLDEQLFFMELFHGPTLAFKDFALQFLGQLLQHLLAQRQQTSVIIGATSGDTGSAAIAGVRGLDAVELFMLHPHGYVSEVQRKQMTTVDEHNIHNIALDGRFDDCQNLVKDLFNDTEFRQKHPLTAVNSINWARIAAQVVYYFRAGVLLGAPDRRFNVSVPTGNFGNILAGLIAKRMGLPIERLIIGSNSNDILTRFFIDGKMQQHGVASTLSPSMDIQISSNFERYLFELLGRDSDRISSLMDEFKQNGEFAISSAELARAKQDFAAHRLDDNETKLAIKQAYEQTGEIIDPHSIIGVAAAQKHASEGIPTVVMGTAHPAKFASAIESALDQPYPLPPRVQAMMDQPEKCQRLANDAEALKALVESTLANK